MARQQRSEQTRRQLVDAAARLFDEVGYVRATMADISEAAGVTKGALYFHFPSKDMLADAVRAEAAEKLEILVARLPLSSAPIPSLVDLHRQVVRWLREDNVVRACLRIGHDTGDPGGFCASWLAATELALRDVLGDRAEVAATLLVGVCLGTETLRWNGIAREAPWELVLPGLLGLSGQSGLPGQEPSGVNRLSLRGGTIDGST